MGSVFFRIGLDYTEIKFISEYKLFKKLKLKLSTKALKTTLESETEYKGIKA